MAWFVGNGLTGGKRVFTKQNGLLGKKISLLDKKCPHVMQDGSFFGKAVAYPYRSHRILPQSLRMKPKKLENSFQDLPSPSPSDNIAKFLSGRT